MPPPRLPRYGSASRLEPRAGSGLELQPLGDLVRWKGGWAKAWLLLRSVGQQACFGS
jgi:hypothetical protein